MSMWVSSFAFNFYLLYVCAWCRFLSYFSSRNASRSWSVCMASSNIWRGLSCSSDLWKMCPRCHPSHVPFASMTFRWRSVALPHVHIKPAWTVAHFRGILFVLLISFVLLGFPKEEKRPRQKSLVLSQSEGLRLECLPESRLEVPYVQERGFKVSSGFSGSLVQRKGREVILI